MAKNKRRPPYGGFSVRSYFLKVLAPDIFREYLGRGRFKALPASVASAYKWTWSQDDKLWSSEPTILGGTYAIVFVKVVKRFWQFKTTYILSYIYMSGNALDQNYRLTFFGRKTEEELAALLAITKLTEEIPDGGTTVEY